MHGKLRDSVSNFGAEQSGAIAIIFALAFFVLACFVGLAIDYGRAVNASAQVATALDAAVLAATEQMVDNSLNSITVQHNVAQYLDAEIGNPRMQGATYSGLKVVIDDTDGSIQLDVDVNVPTTLASLFHVNSMTFHKFNRTVYKVKNVELAMVLDTTGSMANNNKINELMTAAGQAIDILLPAGKANSNRIAVAPFSGAVNAGGFASAASGGLSIDCVTERTGADSYDDVSGATSPVGAVSVGGSDCPTQIITPLTQGGAALKAQINTFTPGGSTAGHIGLAWGWYLLSPNWNTIWPAASRPQPYANQQVIKAVVLMTDGMFNTSYNGVGSDVQALALCDAMKAAGIKIYTIGLELADNGSPDDVNATTLLTTCASPDGHGGKEFYSVASSVNLGAAFTSIAGKLSRLRLSQ